MEGEVCACCHLMVCTLRPDIPCGKITECLVQIAEVSHKDILHNSTLYPEPYHPPVVFFVFVQSQDMMVSKRQGSHVIAEVPAHVTGNCEWRRIDLQVGKK